MIIPTNSGDIDGDEVPSVAGSNVGVTVGVAVGVGFISVSIFVFWLSSRVDAAPGGSEYVSKELVVQVTAPLDLKLLPGGHA